MKLNKILSFLLAIIICIPSTNFIVANAKGLLEDDYLLVVNINRVGESDLIDKIFSESASSLPSGTSLQMELLKKHPSYGIKPFIREGFVDIFPANLTSTISAKELHKIATDELTAQGVISYSTDLAKLKIMYLVDAGITVDTSATGFANSLPLIDCSNVPYTIVKEDNRGYVSAASMFAEYLKEPADSQNVFLEELVTSIQATQKAITVEKDKTVKPTVSITPDTALTKKGLEFTFKNTAIADYDKEKGEIKGLAAGSTEAVVRSLSNPGVYDTIVVTVTDPQAKPSPSPVPSPSPAPPSNSNAGSDSSSPISEKKRVKGVSFTEETYNVQLYKTIDLTKLIKFDPEDAADKRVRFRIRDMELASVNADGELTGDALGKTKVTVYTVDGNFMATATINITADGEDPTGEIPVAGITLERETYNIRTGDIIRLNPIIQPYTADNKFVFWESNDPEIAEVDDFGNVRGIGQGIATITVTTDDGAFKAVTRVMVRPYVTDPEQDTYHFKNDDQYDMSTFEKVMDIKKIKRQIDTESHETMSVKLGTEFILPSELIEYIRDNKKIVTFEHTNYKWRLDYKDIPDGDIRQDVNLKVTTNPLYKADMAKLLTEDAKPQYLDFVHDGELPAKMTFIYRTARSSPVKGYYFYYYNSGYDQLEIADEKLKTDSSRFIEIPMSRCSSYVITETEQESQLRTKDNPLTGR